MPTDHTLPSADHLSSFHGFFERAAFNKDGTCNVTFRLPAEMKEATLELSVNDGMALNVSVWSTALPDEDADLARALGLLD